MPVRPLRRICVALAALTLVALATVLTGCHSDKKITPPPIPSDYLPQSSPANVMANLKTAYEKKNLAEYMKLLSSDFVFVFNPDDARDPTNPTPAQWGLDDEHTSTMHMFTDDLVYQISLDFMLGEPEPADSVTYGNLARKMKIDNANLAVHTRTDDGWELIYMVPGTTELLYFRERPSVLASDGKPTWYIIRWEDKPIGVSKTEEHTWGEVKYVYWH